MFKKKETKRGGRGERREKEISSKSRYDGNRREKGGGMVDKRRVDVAFLPINTTGHGMAGNGSIAWDLSSI